MDLRLATFRGGSRSRGFTLVELLVATVILILIMALVASMTDQVSKIWKGSTAQIESFQAARAAYGTMTMRLRQATLNTYLDYYDGSAIPVQRSAAATSTFVPATYGRASDLHFVAGQATSIPSLLIVGLIPPGGASTHPTHAVFFQAPLGFTTNTSTYGKLPNILNACGYYIEFNSDASYIPSILGAAVNPRYRYRLMEFLQPTEALAVYANPTAIGAAPATYDGWFWNFLPPNVTQANAPVRMLAENIIALVILPELSPRDASASSLAPFYGYDSRNMGNSTTRNQLPPLLRVVMVAIDEPSAQRLGVSAGASPPNFITTALSGLFQDSTKLDVDLNALENTFNTTKPRINYQVYDTDIAIRGAKWSK